MNQDSEQENSAAMDTILARQVFTSLKGSYERIREFKGEMAEKMLRSALLEL